MSIGGFGSKQALGHCTHRRQPLNRLGVLALVDEGGGQITRQLQLRFLDFPDGVVVLPKVPQCEAWPSAILLCHGGFVRTHFAQIDPPTAAKRSRNFPISVLQQVSEWHRVAAGTAAMEAPSFFLSRSGSG